MAELRVSPTAAEAARAAAEYICSRSGECIRSKGGFTIALAGGSTPRLLYETLASPPYAEQIDWAGWHVFWGDERCVPPDHLDSNYQLASETLLDKVDIPGHQAHRMRGEIDPRESAEEYEEVIRRRLGATLSLNLILLGLGDDGHTASLFPCTRAIEEKERLVVADWVPHLGTYRVTFTLPLINAAAEVAFLATDDAKADAVRDVLQPSPGSTALPAARVSPASGQVHWFLTKSSAGRLTDAGVQ